MRLSTFVTKRSSPKISFVSSGIGLFPTCAVQPGEQGYHHYAKALEMARPCHPETEQWLHRLHHQDSFPGGTPYNGRYGEAPPERGTLFQAEGM